MANTSLNISLPESLRDYVEAQVANGGFSTPSEFVRDLIRRDREQEELERKLTEGLESELIVPGPTFWSDLRRAARLTAKARPTKQAKSLPSGKKRSK